MKYVFALALLMMAFSCKKNDDDPAPEEVPQQILLNVAYGTNALQKMDIYLPANRSTASTRVLVMIHGGGWAGGDKSQINEQVDSIRKRLPGYAVFNINYRLALAGANLYPAGNDDVNAAMAFINTNSGQYRVSDKQALLGLSAGGHLALYEAYKNNGAGKIKAVISGFGPTDLTDMWNNPAGTPISTHLGLANYLGVTRPANPALYTAASPITYVTTSSVPTQLFHGTADTIVSINQSILLRNKLLTVAVPVQLTQYTGEGHGWATPNITDTYNKIAAFLQQYLQ